MSAQSNNVTGSRYKLVVFLDDENSLRSKKILERLALSAEVLYVTSNTAMINSIKNDNIKVFSFDTFLNRLHKVFYSLNTHKLAEEIDKIARNKQITLKEILIFSNTLNYGNIIVNFQAPRLHFDINFQQKSIPISELLLEKNLYKRINTISSSKSSLTKAFQNYFRASFKIADGIDVKTFEQPNSQLILRDGVKAGCYCYFPEFVDKELVNMCAQAYKDIQFLFFSDKSFKIKGEVPHNVQYIQTENWLVPLDMVILPFKYDQEQILSRIFYDNLIYQAPILTLKYSEFPVHRGILNQYTETQELFASIGKFKALKKVYRPQVEVLLQSCSWEARLNQLESILISH